MDEEKTIQNEQKKLGRPKNPVAEDSVVDEKSQERLDMEKKEQISIEDITAEWKKTFNKIAALDTMGSNITTVATKWNKLNPFLQNQRIKNLYSRAKEYSKVDISNFLSNPGNHERELRSLAWANSSSQQIYYNILRRSCDIPVYNYFIIPDLLEEGNYKKDDFKNEDRLVHNWLETFDIPVTFKNIALEVKREGKSSYLLRNKFNGEGKNKTTAFCTLQKMPTDWIKITGKGQLGFTISFDMMYFLDIANSPADFGEFMIEAWNSMLQNGVVEEDPNTKKLALNLNKAQNFKFKYKDETYVSIIEGVKKGRQLNYMFWLRLPYDICYTFGSDNSHPWVAPDTMGLMLKLQELTDYGQLAGLIASTPLSAVLTGEIETISNPRAGKNESVYSPEVLQGYMTQFNQATSTNIEAWLWPADVNSSDIISTATENFIESSGDGGLTITDTKPNVAQVTVAKQLAASQQKYVTNQFEQVINFILNHKLGLNYGWKVRIWGDIFNIDNEKKYLKEVVANGNMALLPKLMSAEGISMRDTKAMVDYIKSLDFYKDLTTYTQLKASELSLKADDKAAEEAAGQVGRPMIDDGNIENDATAASREQGTNTSDNREN